MAEGPPRGRARASPRPTRLPRSRAVEARLQGLIGTVHVRAPSGRSDNFRRQPRIVWDRLQLGRLREPGAAGRSASHRHEAAGAQPGAVAHWARGSRRPDRRPFGRIRSGGTLTVDVARFAVAADKELLALPDSRGAADLPRVAPDELGVMSDVLDITRAAVVGEDAGP